jgi:hypothetical protein
MCGIIATSLGSKLVGEEREVLLRIGLRFRLRRGLFSLLNSTGCFASNRGGNARFIFMRFSSMIGGWCAIEVSNL